MKKLILYLTILTLFTSCQKTYKCKCEEIREHKVRVCDELNDRLWYNDFATEEELLESELNDNCE